LILKIGCLLLANMASVLGTHAILRHHAGGRPHLRALQFLLLRLALISGTVLVAGSIRLLSPAVLGGLAGLVVLYAWRTDSLPTWSGRPSVRLHPLLLIFAGSVGVRLLVQVWFFAPCEADALSYHLPKVAEWVRAGRFSREMGLDTHATFPAGFELLEVWWVVFLRHDVLIEMAGVEFLILAAAAVYALAMEIGLSTRLSVLAAVMYALVPGVYFQATSCLNDGAAGAVVVASAALLLARAPWPFILLAGGLGLGVKPTVAYAAPGLVLLWWMRRREVPTADRVSRGLSAGLFLLGLSIGGYWYVRNLLWYGNPLHPVGAAGLAGQEGHPLIQFGPNLTSASKTIEALLNHRIYDHERPFGPMLKFITGWGGVCFGFGLIAGIAAAFKNRTFRILAAAFVLGLASVLCLVNYDPWNLRFVLFFPAILAVATAWMIRRIRSLSPILGAALALQFLSTFLPGSLAPEIFKELARMSWRERSISPLLGIRTEEENVGYYHAGPTPCRGPSYLLYRPDFSGRVLYLRSATLKDLLGDIGRADVAAVFDASGLECRKENLVVEAEERGHLEKGEGALFRVRRRPPSPPADR